MTTVDNATTEKQPVLGERAKLALRVTEKWGDRTDRKVLVLLGAFADAGERSPFALDLAERIGIDVKTLDRKLGALAADGWLWTIRRPKTRNVYVLRFAGDEVPEYDIKQFQRFTQGANRRGLPQRGRRAVRDEEDGWREAA